MSVASPPASSPWGLIEWAVTGLATLLASAAAFVWRLTLRLEAIDANLNRARQELDQTREVSQAAAERLALRIDQLREDYHQLREAVCALPTREDLRNLDARIAERLEALAARLDRTIDV